MIRRNKYKQQQLQAKATYLNNHHNRYWPRAAAAAWRGPRRPWGSSGSHQRAESDCRTCWRGPGLRCHAYQRRRRSGSLAARPWRAARRISRTRGRLRVLVCYVYIMHVLWNNLDKQSVRKEEKPFSNTPQTNKNELQQTTTGSYNKVLLTNDTHSPGLWAVHLVHNQNGANPLLQCLL